MSKGLEAFNKFCDDVVACINSGGIAYIDTKNKKVVEKELKALKIIEFKEIDMSLLYKSFAFEKEHKTLHGVIYYNANINCFGRQLTDEEYSLLKEVFKK